MFGPLHAKLRSRECINVAFIGGSVTVGRGLPNSTAPYTELFGRLAKAAFPCKGRHNVTVFARGATATDYWIDFLVGRQEVLLAGYDLVVVDTSMNDVRELVTRAGRGAPDPNAFIRAHTEVLMALLLHASSRTSTATSANNANTTTTTQQGSSTPAETLIKCAATTTTTTTNTSSTSSASTSSAISNYSRAWTGTAALWLGTSTRRTETWTGPLPRSTDAVHVQLPVALTHGVPYLSIIDGLGPFATPASQHWLRQHWYSEPTRDMHPGPWGHRALAVALVYFLREQHVLLQKGGLPWTTARGDDHSSRASAHTSNALLQHPCYRPRPPAFLSPPALLDVYLDASPLHIPTVYPGTTDARLARCEGWAITTDVPGKPGLLAEKVGSRCTVLASPEEVRRHPVQVGKVHVLLLKSYERMGVVRITVSAVPAVATAPASTAGAGGGEGDSSGGNNEEKDVRAMCQLAGGGSSRRVLGSREVDGLWGERVSEARVEEVPIERLGSDSDEAAAGQREVCLAFTFEVVGRPGRKENKVKVLGLTVF